MGSEMGVQYWVSVLCVQLYPTQLTIGKFIEEKVKPQNKLVKMEKLG